MLIDASGGGPEAPLSLRFHRSGIANNHVDTVLFGRGLAEVVFDEVAVAEPTASSLVWCAWTANRVAVSGSTVVARGLRAVGAARRQPP